MSLGRCSSLCPCSCVGCFPELLEPISTSITLGRSHPALRSSFTYVKATSWTFFGGRGLPCPSGSGCCFLELCGFDPMFPCFLPHRGETTVLPCLGHIVGFSRAVTDVTFCPENGLLPLPVRWYPFLSHQLRTTD